MINFKKILKQLAIPLIIIGIWYYMSKFGYINSYILPSPQKVLSTFIKTLYTQEILYNTFDSLVRIIKGFGSSFVLSFILSILSFYFKTFDMIIGSFIKFFKYVPPISLIPVLILWCGIGELTKIMIIILATFFPMYLNISKGLKYTNKKLIEVGLINNFSNLKILHKIILPNAIPDILVGIKIGIGYAWRAIIVAEMLAASSGLGYFIVFAQQTARIDKVIVGIVVIGIIGFITDRIIDVLFNIIFGERYTYVRN